ncbi:NlpC/P60 family protein [Bifidobacterium simiarum]|uniref:C40 family peptidase n=1 Tax=Bifidobacterium simiarum TaxID=2045441 RepID=UPI001BDC3E7A|nr:NlpC/P60 family protein [Bifidobacterium simiarum]MBT1167220.1 C40 family peptidase [Bifidobacterium simiarum]
MRTQNDHQNQTGRWAHRGPKGRSAVRAAVASAITVCALSMLLPSALADTAQGNAAQTGTTQTGTTQTGTTQTETAQTETAQTEVAQSGAPQSGATQPGTEQTDTAQTQSSSPSQPQSAQSQSAQSKPTQTPAAGTESSGSSSAAKPATPGLEYGKGSESAEDTNADQPNTPTGRGSESTTVGWQQDGGQWYYIENGVPLKGQQRIAGGVYYLDNRTGARRTGWIRLANGRTMYFNPRNGKKVFGEAKIGASWYYFESGSGYRHSGWQKIGNRYCYFDKRTGARLSGTHMIDGYRRWFNPKNGATDKYGWQNKPQYFQVSSRSVTFNRPAPWNYASPSRLSVTASRHDAIEAMISRAYDYMGTPYVWDYALAPGVGVDCAGLVMQSLYATGMNMAEYNPYNHWYDPWHSHDANNLSGDKRFPRVPLSQRQRGDLIFYPGHVAIYLGNDMVIEADVPRVSVNSIFKGGRVPWAVSRPFS